MSPDANTPARAEPRPTNVHSYQSHADTPIGRPAETVPPVAITSLLLIANYRPDGQQSMLRAADLLERELRSSGANVLVSRPQPFFGLLAQIVPRFAKWLAYLDKYLLFPFYLIWQARRMELVHIVDHSNAVYLFWLGAKKTVVNCNDLLAVRSALGEMPENKIGLTGRWLQKWILAGLRQADHLACISDATKLDVLRLTGQSEKKISTIYLGLEPIFEAELERNLSSLAAEDARPPNTPSPRHSQAQAELRPTDTTPSLHHSISPVLPYTPYILHVGGDTWYKNRAGVLDIYLEVRKRLGDSAPNLLMVGSPLKPVVPGVHFLREITDTILLDLYRNAALLLFPSLYEGFGWPVVEAQACGCPTVITGTAPLTEAGGNAAIRINDPRDIHQGADRVIEVLREDEAKRQQRRQAGYVNARRFSRQRMTAQYRELYASLFNE